MCMVAYNVIQIVILLIFHNYILFIIAQLIFTIIENILLMKKTNKLYPYLKEKNVLELERKEKNTITFKEGGVYFIEFMVEVYSSSTVVYPGKYQVVGVGLRKVDETTIYIGGSTWDYQEPVVRINAHGIVTTVLANDEFELVNTAQDTIHLVSPSSNNLITDSFFANPILTMVIIKLQ